ncbi:MAG: biotin--[acetyl-CoA-carboxylase] ligase [Pyrinomonadaceae bacterium]|nr:biotin--[acetyl-CoA-carboxylase] ligase [Sphingobacteriaceae bacterium]
MQNNTFSTLFVGQNTVTLSIVDSTNDYLKNLLSKSAPLPEGTVILAEEQFAGRGQVNNAWLSDPGKNLTFSLLLTPSFLDPEKQFLLNKVISIAINDTLVQIIGADVKIKWPNDIYFKDKKLGGVLIENILRGNKWKYAVVGIGLNINQIEFTSSVKNVTSIKKILHKDYDKASLLNHLCTAIEKYYLQLRSGNSEWLDNQYLQNLYRINEWHSFTIDGHVIDGKITGVNKNGMLELFSQDKTRTYSFKEIAFVI